MSRLARLAALPRQTVGVLRRNGVRNVWRYGADMLGRHGVLRTLRYAIAPPEMRRLRLVEMEQGVEAAEQARSSEAAADFGATWSLPPERWTTLKAVRRAHPAATSSPAAVHLVYGETQAPAGAAGDDWVVLLRAGDQPAPDLAGQVAAAGAAPCTELVSFDMGFARPDGRTTPVLQPGANPWLARYADTGFGRYAFRARVLRRTAGDAHARLRAWMAERSLPDARDRWSHVAAILVLAALTSEEVEAARDAAKARARAELRTEPLVSERVSVVICTRNRGRLVRQLVRALVALGPRIADVVVVANNTTSPVALETLDWVRGLPRCRVLVRDEPFNFSRFCNQGVALTSGERLLFLNDDITPISEDWLEPLLAPLRDPDVGISGPLLLYPDERVQHAGMYLGYRGWSVGHSLRGLRLPEQEYMFYGSIPRQMSATTGAVMMVSREVFEALNGFDELLPTFFQDVDLCLRAGAVGQATVWAPSSELLHMESTTILEDGGAALAPVRDREQVRFSERWGRQMLSDPFHNLAFDLDDESFRTLRT